MNIKCVCVLRCAELTSAQVAPLFFGHHPSIPDLLLSTLPAGKPLPRLCYSGYI